MDRFFICIQYIDVQYLIEQNYDIKSGGCGWETVHILYFSEEIDLPKLPTKFEGITVYGSKVPAIWNFRVENLVLVAIFKKIDQSGNSLHFWEEISLKKLPAKF